MIRIGVLGASGVGAAHIEALRTVEGVEVVAVGGSSKESAAATAARLRVPASFVGSADMIQSGSMDALHVCTPNDLHVDAVRAAFEAGLHVVCEKPLTTNTTEAAELASLAAASSSASTVCYHYRYSTLIPDLVGLIEGGGLGRIHSVRANYLQNWQINSDPSWRNDPARSGASRVLADIGTHLIDLVEFTSDQRITSIDADFLALRGDVQPGNDDVAIALARTSSGALVSLSVSQVSPGHMNSISIELDGEHGTARWSLTDRETLEFTSVEDTAALELDGHANPKTMRRVWHSRLDPEARLQALFGAFYGPLLGTPTLSSISLPSFDDAARHVALVGQAALGITLTPAN
ncbi:Gfo/Idh/MocA family protein [Microbacterium sp. NPDC058389]|uniref:Gfo/Idh/MocA family protein n=1 Tax=Microbacterium sp. NPDC058389 TaxID=3346475 RepID=UPI003647F59F